MTTVSVSRVHFPVTTLGPGRRLGVWLQGCSIRCPGCISVDTWPRSGAIGMDGLVAELASHAGAAEGLTVSGGEPFDQPDALASMLRAWRSLSDASVLVFTGYDLPQIADWLAANPGLVDALMTGPFRSDLPQTVALRGSDNQQLHVLSPLGEELLAFDRTASPADLSLDAAFDERGQVWFAGIPARGDLGRLRRLLSLQGHHAETSDRVTSS